MTDTPRAAAATTPAQVDWAQELARHDRWLRAVVYSRVGQASAVDEVLQEVALAAVRQQAPINDASRVGAWLYRLAVTQSLMFRRRMGRRRRLEDRYAQRQLSQTERGQTPEPLGWLLSEERRALVRRALAALPARDAEILMLKHAEDFSYHQLSTLLGLSHSAVESRLHRARQRLRAELAALEVSEIGH
ncbi:MAG: sigma-70 family RNA polymerase sigma factor [Planctomycetia bacterium]|nr:sigma-70 family RNA polymerase sigma factor [Planctomycetia bacterium]